MVDFWTAVGRAISPAVGNTLIYLFGVLSAKSMEWLKKKKNSKSYHNVSQNAEANYKLDAWTEMCREALGPTAMRVYYSKFINGEKFNDEEPVWKKQLVSESLRAGVAPIDKRFGVILISRVMDEYKLLVEPGPSYTYVDDLPHQAFRYICKDSGVQAVARVGVYGGRHVPENLIGYVGADFDGNGDGENRPPPPRNLEEIVSLALKIEQAAKYLKG